MEKNADIILIIEPYMNPESYIWYEHASKKAAIMISKGSMRVDDIGEGNNGFVDDFLYDCNFDIDFSFEQEFVFICLQG